MPKFKDLQHKIDRLKLAAELWESIWSRHNIFKTSVASRSFDKARDFTPINPLDEWVDISHAKAKEVRTLIDAGLIQVVELQGNHYARPAQ